MKKTIFLAASIFTLFCGVTLAQNTGTAIQKHTVSGIVMDAATNKPIPGANIEVTGIASAITDDNGHYIISQLRKISNCVLVLFAIMYRHIYSLSM